MDIRQKHVSIKEMIDKRYSVIQYKGIYYYIGELIAADRHTIINNAMQTHMLEFVQQYKYDTIKFESIDLYLDSNDNPIGCNIRYTIENTWGERYARGETHLIEGFIVKGHIDASEKLYDLVKIFPHSYHGSICW